MAFQAIGSHERRRYFSVASMSLSRDGETKSIWRYQLFCMLITTPLTKIGGGAWRWREFILILSVQLWVYASVNRWAVTLRNRTNCLQRLKGFFRKIVWICVASVLLITFCRIPRAVTRDISVSDRAGMIATVIAVEQMCNSRMILIYTIGVFVSLLFFAILEWRGCPTLVLFWVDGSPSGNIHVYIDTKLGLDWAGFITCLALLSWGYYNPRQALECQAWSRLYLPRSGLFGP